MNDAPRLHLVGLVSDGGVHSSIATSRRSSSSPRRRASRRRRPRLHRRARHVARRRRRLPRTVGAVRWPHGSAVSARSSGATSGWTATTARAHRARATSCSSTGDAEHHAGVGEAAVRAAYERDETDEFIAADHGRRRGARSARTTCVVMFNFRPDRMRADRRRARATSARALRDADRVRGGLAVPGRVPARAARRSRSRTVIADARRDAAARRRDREVPARDVLLQRRRGGRRTTASGASSSRRRATSRRTTSKPEMSAREAADAFVRRWREDDPALRDHQLRQPRHGRPHRRRSRPRSRRCETVDACLGDVVEAVLERGGVCDRHRRPRQRRRDARGRRLARHRPLAQPGPVRRHRRRTSTLDGEGILADVAPTVLALLGIEQPAEMTGRSLLAGDETEHDGQEGEPRAGHVLVG